MHMPEVTKTETKKLFDEVKNKFERHYSPDGRQSQKKNCRAPTYQWILNLN